MDALKSYEIKSKDDDGELILRFEGTHLAGPQDLGIYRSKMGRAVLFFEDSYQTWETEAMNEHQESFATAVWKCLNQYGNTDQLGYVLGELGIARTVEP